MKLRAIFILMLLATTASWAETHYKPHISVGAHAGMDLSRVSFNPSVEQKWNQGLCGGVSLRYAEEKLVGIIAEVNISQRGWSELFEDSPLSYSRTFTYASVPIMTHITFGPPRFKCFFNLGPEFSFRVGEAINSNFDYHNPTSAEGWPHRVRRTEQLTAEATGKFDYGIVAGFGCEFFVKPRHSLYAEARYYFGLGNIFPSSKADTFNASRNSTISVALGYYFRIY